MTNGDEQRSEVLAVESLWVQGPVHVSTAGPGSEVVRACARIATLPVSVF